MAAKPQSAAALIIGNELLTGKIREANLFELAKLLRNLGVVLKRVEMILDDVDTISQAITNLSNTHDHVFTSGGVGPTHDDVTIDGVAQAFGVEVVEDADMAALLRGHYGQRLRPGHLRMARVPAGCERLASAEVPWPMTKMRNVWVLPGIPEIFRMKLAIVRRELGGQGQGFSSRAVYSNLDEGTLKPLLDQVVREFADIDVGSYPTWNSKEYRTKLTFDGTDRAVIDSAVERFGELLPEGEPVSQDEPLST